MNETQMQDVLCMLLPETDAGELTGDGDGGEVVSVTTFEEAGILTNNKGVVVRMEDGSEFQVTIVQSA